MFNIFICLFLQTCFTIVYKLQIIFSNMVDRLDERNSDYLTGIDIPNQLKREIFHHALQLFVYNAILMGRPDKHYYIISGIGVLLSFIPISYIKKYFLISFASFIFVLHDFPMLFYIIYGYVLASTYQSVSILFLCLSSKCIEFLRKLEILCLIVPFLIPIRFNYPIFAFFIFTFFNIWWLAKPPVEINCSKDENSKKQLLPAIRRMVLVEDYVLIAREHREVIGYNFGKAINRKYCIRNLVDLFLPAVLQNLSVILKSCIFIMILIPFKRYYCLNFVFFFFLILEMNEFLLIVTPFCDWMFTVYPENWYISLTILGRIIIGYVVYCFSIFYLE